MSRQIISFPDPLSRFPRVSGDEPSRPKVRARVIVVFPA